MSKVSVILTSYNKKKYITQAIASVMAQTYVDWELIIVDDLSTDGSWQEVLETSLLDKRIKFLHTDLGPHTDPEELNRYAHNINLAFKKATGDYITYLCDDDLYYPLRLEMMTRRLDANQNIMIVYGAQQVVEDGPDGLKMVCIRDTKGILHNAAGVIDHSSVMHRRECFEKVGGWNEDIEFWRIGDAAFWHRLNQHWPFYPVNEITDIHRFNPLSVSYKLDHPCESSLQIQ